MEQSKYYQGMVHLKNEEYELAREVFQQLTEQDPNDAEAHAWLAATYGRLLEMGSMIDKVMLLPTLEQEVAAALELDGELLLARKVNGLRLLHTPQEFGGNLEEAIQELEYVAARESNDSDVFYGLGLAYLAMGNKDQAIEAFIRTLQSDPNHPTAQQQIEYLHKGASL